MGKNKGENPWKGRTVRALEVRRNMPYTEQTEEIILCKMRLIRTETEKKM